LAPPTPTPKESDINNVVTMCWALTWTVATS